MKKNELVLSICIPTYERPELLKKTLESIFSQNVSPQLYEVCISDDSKTDDTKIMIDNFFSNIENLIYKKIEPISGYQNLVEALKIGNGKFLRLHNDYTLFCEGKLMSFIQSLINYTNNSVYFLSQNNNHINSGITICEKFDSFMESIGIWCSWATAFGIWKTDFDYLLKSNIKINEMFPHVSLLFELYNKDVYVIDNNEYFFNLIPDKKGGYNLPEVFGEVFLNMCRSLYEEKKVSDKTFLKIKNETLHFIAEWYYKVHVYSDKYTFTFSNWRKKVKKVFGIRGIVVIKTYYVMHFFIARIKKILKRY